MKNNITYCNNETCLHKMGCSRNLIHYTLLDDIKLSMIDGEDCNNDNLDAEDRYTYLIRFRNSDGSKLKK